LSILKTLAVGLLALSITACFEDKPQRGADPTVGVPPPPVNQAPSIGGLPTEATIVAGNPFQLTPTATDPENDPLIFEIENRPVWASFNAATGRLSGTPADANVGTFENVRISVRDGVNVTHGNIFRVVVNARSATPPGNRPPVISGSPPNSTMEGQAYTFTPSASDPDGQSLTFSISGRPSWASFNSGNGRLAGTPGAGSTGNYPNIRISVSDGASSTSLPAFTITVTTTGGATNRPPVISGSPATSGREGIAYSFTPTASDPDGNPLTFSISNRPSWASFSTSNGRLSGTPPAGRAGNYAGILISVSDGSQSVSLSSFSINVTANRAPTISGTPATAVSTGQAYSFTPTAADADGNTLTFSIVNRPSWATLTTTTGRLSGTPSTTAAGEYVDIRISVGDGSATTSLAPFSITVDQANRPPTISGAPATAIVVGQAYSFTPSATDPDGDTLSFSIAGRPSWAAFNTSTGRLSGTPGAGTVGSYPNVRITVSDDTLQASLAAFSISVQQAANGSATVSWRAPTTRSDGSPLRNLAGYRIRHGNSSGSYPNTITISNPGVTTYVVGNLASGTHYFVLASYDTNGLESANSSPASKTIP
jgi:putative Ig domain-containing protein